MASRIVLGMSSTVDDEVVWDEQRVADLISEMGIGPHDLRSVGPVHDLRTMVATLVTHVAEGSGAEHYVTAPELLAEFVGRFESLRTLGGTGVRAGIALAATGVASTAVMAAADPDVHRLLPPACRAVAAVEVPQLVPHLIVQYPAGATLQVGDVTVVAPAPNRVIFAHDVPNERLDVPDVFPTLVADADVVLVSSLNAIRDPAVLAARLEQIGAALRGAPPAATVIWEDAGYHIGEYALLVTRAMAASAHVVSMNEDELQAHLARRVDLLDAGAVARACAEARELVGARTLVVHTRFWSLAVGDDAERYRAALRGGIAMASARYAFGDGIGLEEYVEAGS
ncbi:MAG: hypothetical protein HGA44_11555, partial [Cellulomonadaceae bacterium]|nr:hypothetical protein [Cellulomonadaceae bacterium]